MNRTEWRLWLALRTRQVGGFKFRRQVPIPPFIADFACISQRLVVEIEGSGHESAAQDCARTEDLARRGWRVLRLWSSTVNGNLEWVIEQINLALLDWEGIPHPSPASPLRPFGPPPPLRRGGHVEIADTLEAADTLDASSPATRGRWRAAPEGDRGPDERSGRSDRDFSDRPEVR